jgi:hypothetical protein
MKLLTIKTTFMKKTLFLIFLSSAAILASGQELRLNAYSSYVFDDGYSSYYDSYNYYSGKIEDGVQWGGGLEYVMGQRYCVELMYQYRSTHAPTSWQGGVTTVNKTTNFDLKVHYIMLGADSHMPSHNGKVEGYGGLFAGVAISDIDNPENGNSSSATKFAWGLRLGANIWATEKVGVKLQAQLFSAVQSAGGGFYFGTGGSGVGLSTYSTIYQFGLGGGLTFKLGNKSAK